MHSASIRAALSVRKTTFNVLCKFAPQSYLKGNVNSKHLFFFFFFKYRNCSIFARLKTYALVLTDLRFKNGATGNASGPDMRSSVPTPLLLFTSLKWSIDKPRLAQRHSQLNSTCMQIDAVHTSELDITCLPCHLPTLLLVYVSCLQV